jgi:hypothetical protein
MVLVKGSNSIWLAGQRHVPRSLMEGLESVIYYCSTESFVGEVALALCS